MSHKVKISLQLKNLQAIKKAFISLGWSLKENVEVRGWGSASVVTPLAAINPQHPVDIVIQKPNKAADYELYCHGDHDYLDRMLVSIGGRAFNKLKQKYAIEIIREQATLENKEITVQENANGTYEITVHA